MKQKNTKSKTLIELANRIKKLGRERNLTQEDCYNDTGLHFGRIEQGKRDLRVTSLVTICEYFNISLKDLLKESNYCGINSKTILLASSKL